MERPFNRNVLAIGVSKPEFQRFVPFLARQSFEVDRFPSGVGALELIDQVPFEMLLVRFPLPDMDLESFLSSVRRNGSPCHGASLIVLAASTHETEAEQFIGQGANRTLSLEASEETIQSSISGLLNVAPRKAARFLARMEIRIGGAKDMLLCQTENMSSTGMLVRTDRRYEIGTQIEFEFSVVGDPRPLRGVAEVVRHTRVGRDRVGGIGMRFLSFAGDSQLRFEGYLEQL
ncbi:MAG: PilZ domain-containing protein [Acidobacteriota bacterium]